MLSSRKNNNINLLHALSTHMMTHPFFKKILSAMRDVNPPQLTPSHIEACKEAMMTHRLEAEELFIIALREKHLPTLEMFLKAGWDIDQSVTLANNIKIPPLILALQLKHASIAMLFINQYHAKIDIVFNQCSALYYAAGCDLALVKLLLERHALIDLDKGVPALVNATYSDQVEIAHYLLDKGADVNIEKTERGEICLPLLLAISHERVELTKLLLERGARINSLVKEEIAKKIRLGKIDIVAAALLHANENTYEIDDPYHPYQSLPEDQALKNKLIHLLMSCRVLDIERMLLLKRKSMLEEFFVSNQIKDFVDLFTKMLIDKSNPNKQHKILYSLICNIFEKGCFSSDKVALLNELMPLMDKVIIPAGMLSLLNISVIYGNEMVTKYLLENGHDPNQLLTFNEVSLPLTWYAVSLQNENIAMNILNMLIKSGADINSVSGFGKSVLFEAVKSGSISILNFLIQSGSNIYLRDVYGFTALDYLIPARSDVSFLEAYFSHTESDVSRFFASIEWAAKCKKYSFVSWLLCKLAGKKFDEKKSSDQLSVCDNYIVSLILSGASLEEIRPILEWVSQDYIDASFMHRLTECIILIENKFILSPLSKAALEILIDLRFLLRNASVDSLQSILVFLSKCDFIRDNSEKVENVANILLLIFAEHVISSLSDLCESAMGEKDGDDLHKINNRINLSIELANKLVGLVDYFSQAFYVGKYETNLYRNISSALILLHEYRQSVETKIDKLEKQKIAMIQQAETWQMREKKRLLDLELARLKAEKVQEMDLRRNEQSRRDRDQWEKSNGYIQLDKKKSAKYCTSDFFSRDQAVQTVKLTSDVLAAFELLSAIQGEAYLVGGAVLGLLTGSSLDTADIDMVATTSSSVLTGAGFYKSQHVDGLHTYKNQGVHIDLVARDAHRKKWKSVDVRSRDFTICQLYCDSQGRIYDPTGRGFDDFKQKRLSMGRRDAVQSCQRDPVRILRAIKYIGRGYRPDEGMIKAFEATASSNFLVEHRERLYGYTRYYLRHYDCQIFMRGLVEFNLLKQLFGVEQEGDSNDLICRLWGVIQEKIPENDTLLLTPKR